MSAITQLLWLGLPLILAGFLHLAVLKRDWLSDLRRAPLDFGWSWRGHRLFGANKTWRGALVMVIGTAMACVLLESINQRWLHVNNPVPFAAARPALWGGLLGAGYILGELPNSFLKRQLGIAPGAAGHGGLGALFWLVDQLDSLVGLLLVSRPFWQPTWQVVLTLVVLMLVAHPFGAWVMVRFGLKDRIG